MALAMQAQGLPSGGHVQQEQRNVSPSLLPTEKTFECESNPGGQTNAVEL